MNSKFITEEKPVLLAVYGSLRRGLGNHGVLERIDAEFVGEGNTLQPMNMYSLGGFPSLSLEHSDNDNCPRVEVYRISQEALEGACDRLEGHYPDNPKRTFYDRTQVPVVLDGMEDGNVTAWIYHIDIAQGSDRLVEDGDWKRYVEDRNSTY